MLRWAFKSLITEPMSFLLTSFVVGIALLLVIFFQAVFNGESEKIIAYPEKMKPDVWVMQRGVFNMHMATSLIWDWKKDRVAKVEGVARVTPVLYLNSIVEVANKHWFSYVVGVEENNPRAGPWKMASGRSQPRKGEAVIPVILAKLTGLKLGDHIRIANRSFTVVGFSEGTFSMANTITFVSYADLKNIMSLTGSDSYLLVDARPGVDPVLLAKRIREQVDNVNALPEKEFIKNDKEMAMQMGVELIGIMTVIGAALAIFLSVFMLYVFVAKNQRNLAVLKALGVNNRDIYTGVALQATTIALSGLVISIILIYVAIPFTDAYVPQVSLQITLHSLLRLGFVALLVAVLTALLPARQVTGIDPMLAFKH